MELSVVRNTIEGVSTGGRRPPSNRRIVRMSDDGKKQRYDPAANLDSKFNTQNVKLGEENANQFIEQSEKYLKKVQDIYKKKDRESFGGKKNRAQSMKRSKETQNSSQASNAAAAAVLIYQRKQGGKSQNRNQQRTVATNQQQVHSTYQTNKSNANDNNPQNSDLLVPLYPTSVQPMSGYGTQLGGHSQNDQTTEPDNQYTQMTKMNSASNQIDATAHSMSQ